MGGPWVWAPRSDEEEESLCLAAPPGHRLRAALWASISAAILAQDVPMNPHHGQPPRRGADQGLDSLWG